MKFKAKKMNNPNCDYLTEGKVYEARPALGINNDRFVMFDDTMQEIVCLFKGCKRIGGDWTIITEPAKVR